MKNNIDINQLKIVEFNQDRFIIIDNDGVVIDDAQGYGYKTKQKAFLAMKWKYGGGKANNDKNQNDYKNWLNSNPIHKTIAKEFNGLIEGSFKEISRGETNIDEIWKELENEYSIEIPNYVKKQINKN